MKCRKVRRWLPLYIGRELSPRKIRVVTEHLKTCRDCRRECSHLDSAVDQTRHWLQQQDQGWCEAAWQQALKRAIPEKPEPGRALRPWPFKPAVAYALMVCLAAALTLLIVRPAFIPSGSPREITQAVDIQDYSALSATASDSQDVVAVTLVSRETGLKVQWFFNRNYNLKEDTE